MTDDIKCPICGSTTSLQTSKKSGRKFYVCINYPECKGKVAFDEERGDDLEEERTAKPRVKMPKVPTAVLIKTLVFGALLVGAGCFLGLVLRWCGDRSVQVFAGTGDFWGLLWLGCWALGALITVAVTAGLVAVLIRPFWVVALMLLVSALALFLCWEISLASLVVALIYLVMGLIYITGVRAEINDRIKFRVGNIRHGQGAFLTVLVVLICTGLYFGSARSIDRNGFSLSPSTVDSIVNMADSYGIDRVASAMGTKVNASDKQEALTQLRDYLENDFKSNESYKDFTPVILAVGAFAVLNLVMLLFSWLSLLVLWLIFLILLRSNVVKKKTHSVEVTRLSIE